MQLKKAVVVISQRLCLTIALSISAAVLSNTPARAQYDTFEPPFGFYLNYQCDEDLSAKLWTSQGGLALTLEQSGQSLSTWALAGPVAVLEEDDKPAWKYVFQHPETEYEHIVLYDYWESDNAETLQRVDPGDDRVLGPSCVKWRVVV